MTDVPAKPGNRSFVGIFVLVVILFIIGMIVYVPDHRDVFEEQSAMENMDSLWFSIQSLARGDIIGFIEYLVEGLPIVGLFFVLFAILHFLFSTVLKNIFRTKRTAGVMAFVVACYGFIDHRIYNYMLNLNVFAIGFLVFSVLVIFLWGLGKQGLKSTKESHELAEVERKKYRSEKERARAIKKKYGL